MTEQERINQLAESIATAFNQVLPSSLDEDILQEIESKNSIMAKSIAKAINVFCKKLTVEVELTNTASRKVLGIIDNRDEIETSLHVVIPNSIINNASANLKISSLDNILKAGNSGDGTVKLQGEVR